LAAKFGGEAIPFDSLAGSMAQADIVICSTGSPDYLITKGMVQAALASRRNQPIFLIDISVPRNIDPDVGEINNVFVFDMDDLVSVVTSNLHEREREAEHAEQIVECEVRQFAQTLRQSDIGPTLGAVRRNLQEIARAELTRQRHRLGALSAEQERAIEALLMGTVNKISHPVIHKLRRSYEAGETEFVDSCRDIFGPVNLPAFIAGNESF
jgi:glutamyl-tRNA reductase